MDAVAGGPVGLAGAQVEARAVQPALEGAAVDLALGQGDVGVRADVAHGVDATVGVAHDGDRGAVDDDSEDARHRDVDQLADLDGAHTDTSFASSGSVSRPSSASMRDCRLRSHSGRSMREMTSAKKPRTTSRVATSAGMPRDCR